MHNLGHSVEAGPLMAAADNKGQFAVLVPLLPGEGLADGSVGKAIHLSRTSVGDRWYARVTCREPELNDVFIIFVRDLVERLPTEGPCVKVLTEHVDHWKQLFTDSSEGGLLSPAQAAGLMAELLTLERILSSDPERKLSAWTGPLKSQHDFRYAGHALEIKATLAREGHRTKISSIEQLNAPDGCSLHLSFFKFIITPDGDSLPDVVGRIRTMGIDLHEFELLMLRAGYRAAYEGVYEAYCFDILNEYTFDVTILGFPRLVPAMFPNKHVPHGVEQISYVIDLAGSLEKTLSSSQLKALYQTLGQGLSNA